MNSIKNLEFLDNDYVSTIMAIVLVVYALTLSRMPLPNYIRNLFGNSIFRILILTLLLIINFDKSPSVSIIIAIVFVLTLDYINQIEEQENFMYIRQQM